MKTKTIILFSCIITLSLNLFAFAEQTGTTPRIEITSARWTMEFLKNNKVASRLILLSDDPLKAKMNVTLGSSRNNYYIKPDLNFYLSENRRRFPQKLAEKSVFDEYSQTAAKYHCFTSVYEHIFTVRLEQNGTGICIWLDGRFLGTLPPDITGGRISISKGNEILTAADVPALRKGRFLPLALKHYSRPGTLRFMSQINGFSTCQINTIEGIPVLGTESQDNIDVGLSQWLEEKSDPPDFCDRDTTRSAFDGNPESIILRVPKHNYVAAHILCAVESSKDKIPALTLRLTRFGNHSGDSGGRSDRAFGDTTVYLPAQKSGDAVPSGVKQFGEIEATLLSHSPWNNLVWNKTKLPVYMITVPIKTGEVADLLGEDAPSFGREQNFWDIELTKELRTAVQFFNLQNCRVKPLGLPSAVHVFAVTLEQSPVDVQVTAKEKGSVFYEADDPALTLRFTNHQDKAVKLGVTVDIKDFYGRKTEQKLKVDVPGKKDNEGVSEREMPLSLNSLGYFEAVISVTLPDGREIWRQPTTFALLPQDRRKAGPESPFGVWWFCGTHGSCDKLETMGPILMKMGMRHICPSARKKYTENDLSPYKLSYSMVPTHRQTTKEIEEFLQKNPGVRIGMIFHEKGVAGTPSLYPPPELLGNPMPEIPEESRGIRWGLEERWKQAEETAKWYRENHPDIKLSFGNSPSALSIWFMRYGFPKRYIDYFGMEGVGGWIMPESQPRRGAMQEVFWLSEMRKIYGYEDIPVSSGYEYIGRCSQPGALTEKQQGELHARDALHCLAYGYPSINIGLADDCADSYYNTIYGASGFVHRNPLLTPKPAYVIFATLTLVLDSAEYKRYLDTGLNSLYMLEFSRGEEHIYPFWSIRGKRSVTVHLKAGGNTTLTDSMGNTRNIFPEGNVVKLEAGTTPAYLVSRTPVEKVIPGKVAFEERPPSDPLVVNDMTDPSTWEVENEKDTYLETYADDILYTQGRFNIHPVDDEEKGKVTEIELIPQPEVPKFYSRYVSIKLKNPVKLNKEVQRIGAWVKGNGCWGRIFWEFVDANGERYFSASDETTGWDVSDWKCKSSINFDGWFFVSLSIPKRYPGGYHGPEDRDWSYEGGDLDGTVQHPVTVTRIVVAMRDWQVYVTDMVPAKSRSIRLGSMIAGD
jgi:hypothetical protein